MTAEEEIEKELKATEGASLMATERWKNNPSQSRYPIGYADGLRFALNAIRKEKGVKDN